MASWMRQRERAVDAWWAWRREHPPKDENWTRGMERFIRAYMSREENRD